MSVGDENWLSQLQSDNFSNQDSIDSWVKIRAGPLVIIYEEIAHDILP